MANMTYSAGIVTPAGLFLTPFQKGRSRSQHWLDMIDAIDPRSMKSRAR
jgi:hypothetical protein